MTSQCATLLKRMQEGYTVTPDDAYRLCGTLACHSRMAEIRERGWPIQMVMIEADNGKRVGCYSLPEKFITRPTRG